MNEEGITCRIRLKNGVYTGTIKKHIMNSDASIESDIKVRNGIYDNGFIDMGLQLQGELVTERCILLKNSNCEVVLDKNTYLGYTDYELEIEYSKDNEYNVGDILSIFLDMLKYPQYHCIDGEGVHSFCGILSKSQRFFELKAMLGTRNNVLPKLDEIDTQESTGPDNYMDANFYEKIYYKHD